MASQEKILEASSRHPKPQNTFQYGTAGVSELGSLDPALIFEFREFCANQ